MTLVMRFHVKLMRSVTFNLNISNIYDLRLHIIQQKEYDIVHSERKDKAKCDTPQNLADTGNGQTSVGPVWVAQYEQNCQWAWHDSY